MINICFINTNKNWGGGEKWHFQMAQELSELGHKVTVVTNIKSELLNKLKTTSLKTKSFKIGKMSFICPKTFKSIFTFFQDNHFDAVIMNLPSDVKSFSRAAKKAGIKKIIYRRGMNHPIKASIINNYIYRNFITDFIANSEDVKKSIFKNIPELEDKVTVIFNGINIENIQEVSQKVSKEKLLIGNLGRLVEQKGQADLIELGKKLKDLEIPFHMYIAGDGPLKAPLQDKINQLGLVDSITLLGMTEPSIFFDKIDIFLFTSRFEGLSNALLESLQFRKPIICYNTASNSEVVYDNDNGFLVNYKNIQMMLDKTIELNSNFELYKKMQKNAKITLLTKFDQEKMIHKLVELIKK